MTATRSGAAIAAVVVAGGAAVARRRHRLVASAARELRHRRLYLPLSIRGRLTLRLGRRTIAAAVPRPVVPPGVRMCEQVTDAGGEHPVRLLVYAPIDAPSPTGALLWIHGGGLVMGTAEQAHDLCVRFADELGVVVVSVDYRLAPEHPFPAGLEDCHTALRWVHEHAGALGIDPSHVAVGGDSAGGGLAACLAQLASDRGGPPIAFQLLLYPMLDDRTALRRRHDGLLWSAASNRYAWAAYLGHPVRSSEDRPYAAAARRADLHGLPPAWIGVGDIDLFHDECVDYAARLNDAGVPCELHVVPGMYHAAEHLAPDAPAMRELVEGMASALRTGLGSGTARLRG